MATFTNTTKNASTATNISKNISTASNVSKSLVGASTATAGLYQGFGLFTYSGGEILAAGSALVWSNTTKN